MRDDVLKRHVLTVHFQDRSKCMPKKLDDMMLAHGEWVIKPYWAMERESFDQKVPQNPRLEDEDGETELP